MTLRGNRQEKKGRPRVSRKLSRTVGVWLGRNGRKIRRRDRNCLATACGVSVRTLWNWKRDAQKEPKRLGRPGHDACGLFWDYLAVGRELQRQGWSGWRAISEKVDLPVRLIQRCVRDLKARRRARRRRRIEQARVRTEVLASNVIWTQDSTHLGRVGFQARQAEVLKDRGPLRTVGLSVGRNATGGDVIDLFEAMKHVRGLPLVASMDNGPIYVCDEVVEYCQRELMVLLRSRTYTPQDNGAAEVGIGELKAVAGLGKGVLLQSTAKTAAKLLAAAETLDRNRPRASKGYRTAMELDSEMPRWYGRVCRDEFYRQAQTAMQSAARDGMTARERCYAEREAVYSTLESFGLVKRTRGGRSTRPVIPENIL